MPEVTKLPNETVPRSEEDLLYSTLLALGGGADGVTKLPSSMTPRSKQDLLYSIMLAAQAIDGGGSGLAIASQAEALAGTDNTKAMTPLRVQQKLFDVIGAPTAAGTDMLTAADAIAQAALLGSIGGNGSDDAGKAVLFGASGDLSATSAVRAIDASINDYSAGVLDGCGQVAVNSTGITFSNYLSGTVASGTLVIANLTDSRTWTLPDASGGLLLDAAIGTTVQPYSSQLDALAAKSLTGSGNLVCATSPTLVTPTLGTPASGTLTNCTGLPIASGVSGLGSGIAAALALAANNAAGGIPLNAASKWTLGDFGDITTSNNSGLFLGAGSTRMMYLSCINGTIQVLAASLGFSVNTTANNHDLIVGRAAAATLQLGVNHATTATKQTIKAHDVTTGTGATLCLAGGTGSSAGGAVEIATSTTTGAPTVRMTVKANGNINMTLPTSSAGLAAGDLWNNSGVVTVA